MERDRLMDLVGLSALHELIMEIHVGLRGKPTTQTCAQIHQENRSRHQARGQSGGDQYRGDEQAV